MSEGKLGLTDVVVGAVLLLIGILMVVYAQQMPLMGPKYVAPGMFPTVIGMILLLLSALLLVPSIKNVHTLVISKTKRESVLEIWKRDTDFKKLLFLVTVLVVYLISFSYVSYFIASLLFIGLLMFAFKASTVIKTIIIALVTTGAITYLFGTLFRIPLP